MNEVTIKGLKCWQKYYYEIFTDGQLLASGKDYYFITEQEKDNAFSFYAMGDIGNASKKSGFQDVTARQISYLKNKPDFVNWTWRYCLKPPSIGITTNNHIK